MGSDGVSIVERVMASAHFSCQVSKMSASHASQTVRVRVCV